MPGTIKSKLQSAIKIEFTTSKTNAFTKLENPLNILWTSTFCPLAFAKKQKAIPSAICPERSITPLPVTETAESINPAISVIIAKVPQSPLNFFHF